MQDDHHMRLTCLTLYLRVELASHCAQRFLPPALLSSRLPPTMQPPQGVRYEDVSPENLPALKRLNSTIFPLPYSDRLYEQCLVCGPVTQLAYVADQLVGAIACRLEEVPDGARLHIMTLGVLSACRNMGIGSELLRRSLKICEEDDAIREATLHVQVNNEDAVRFYEKFGFEVGETVLNYYKRIDPPDAFRLTKKLK